MGIVEIEGQKIQIGLKCNPNECPRCGSSLEYERLEQNLTRIFCVNKNFRPAQPVCGYSARERENSLRFAHQVYLSSILRDQNGSPRNES